MRTRTTKLKNKKMNSETYALRRKVIDLIYEAKQSVDLPRIDVRITERDTCRENGEVLGIGRIRDNIIWISERAIEAHNLRWVVFHEIGHAVFGARHDDSMLMNPYEVVDASRDDLHNELKRVANGKGA